MRNVVEELLRLGDTSVEELARRTKISPEDLTLILSSLPGVVVEKDRIKVGNKLLLVIEGVKKGLPVKRLSRYISWRDFEKLSAEILSAHGYSVYTNVIMTKPVRLEIDVVGVDVGSGKTLVIDCKHWIHGLSKSMLYDVGRKHYDRVKKFLKYLDWITRKYPLLKKVKYAVPVVVTLTTPKIRNIDNRVIVVNIGELNNFLQDFYLVLDELGIKITSRDDVLLNKVFG